MNELLTAEVTRTVGLLTSGKRRHRIYFADGTVVTLTLSKNVRPSPEGNYTLLVKFRNKGRAPEEIDIDFKPSNQSPTIYMRVVSDYGKDSRNIDSIEIVEKTVKRKRGKNPPTTCFVVER